MITDITLGQFFPGHSPIHKLDPRTKILLAMLFIVAVFVANNPGLKILDTEYIEENYAIAVAKENEQLLADINKALKELIDDGTVKKVIEKYIPAE